MAKGANVANAIVTVIPSMKGARQAIEGSITPAASSAGDKAGEAAGEKLGKKTSSVAAKVLAGAAAVATMKAAIDNVVHKALDNYAQYEQLAGGVDTLFKESSNIIKQYADEAYKTAGLSANNYMDTVTSFSASLLQGLKGDTKKAAEYANMAVIDMSDNANKMGTDIGMIQNAYQGFAKQNYTMLDNLKLGYGVTQAEMARLIHDSGVLGNTMKVTARNVNEVSFDKIVEAIHKVQENMGIAGTTSLEAAETIEGSINSMKSQWENWLTALGRTDVNITEETKKLVDSVVVAAKNVIPRLGQIKDALGSVILDAIPSLATDAARGFASSYGINLDKFLQDTGIGEKFNKYILPIIEKLPQAFETAKSTVVGKIGEFIAPIAEKLPQAIENIKTSFSNLGNGLLEKLKPLIGEDGVFTKLATKAKETVDVISAVMPSLISQSVIDFFSTLGDKIKMIGDFLAPIGGSVIETIKDLATSAQPIISDIVEGVKKLFENFTNVGAALAPIVVSLLPLFSGIFQWLMPILQFVGTLIMRIWDLVIKVANVVMAFLQPLIDIISNTLAPLLSGIGLLLQFLAPFFEKAMDDFGQLVDNVLSGIGGVLDFIAGVPSAVIGFFSDLPTNMGKIGEAVGTFVREKFIQLILFIAGIPAAVIGFFSSLPGKFWEKFTEVKNIVGGIFEGIIDNIRSIPERIINFFKSIPEKIGEIFRNIHIPTFHVSGDFNLDPFNFKLPEIQFFAKGGIVNKPTLGVIGEGREPEVVLTQSKLRSFVGDIEPRSGGGDTNVFIDGAKVNDDEQINELVLALLTTLFRKMEMNRG